MFLPRLVRALLGDGAISDKKLAFGSPLTVLGIDIALHAGGIDLSPEASKRVKWSRQIKNALDNLSLTPGEASKLAGRLSWASQACFKRLGRALLYPLYRQQRARHSSFASDSDLALALRWWLEVLVLDWSVSRRWQPENSPSAHLFCDARGSPARIAAVLYLDKKWYFSDLAPPAKVISACNFCRRDNQIMGLEILSIAFGANRYISATGLCTCACALPRHEHFQEAHLGQECAYILRQCRRRACHTPGHGKSV